MDPISIMGMLNSASPGVLSAGASVLGSALAPTPKTTTVTSASNGTLDGSGWNVNFGGGSITSTASKDNPVTWIVIGAGLIALAIVVRAWKGK